MNNQPLQPLGALLSRTFAFYRANLRFVVLVTLPVVAFVDVMLGIGLGELTASVHKTLPAADGYIEGAANELVSVPIVTAILARAVVIQLREDALPTARRAAEEGLEIFTPALLVVIVFWCGVGLGSFLIVPAVYWFVSWFFVVQAVAIDGARGFAAIAMSARLVRGHWWHSAGVVLCLWLVQSLIVIAFTPFAVLATSVNSYAIAIAGIVLVDAFALPFVAIGATLYYLELRDRAQLAVAH